MSQPPRDPDVATDRLLRQALRQPSNAGPTAACPDAETLAAWLGGGLTGDRIDQARAHVADCAHCQAVLAAMVRTESDAAGAAPAPRRWWAWAVPLAAAAAAVLVWAALPRGRAVVSPPVDQRSAMAEAKDRDQLAAAPAPARDDSRARGDVKDVAAAQPGKLNDRQKKAQAPAEPKAEVAAPAPAAPPAATAAVANAPAAARELGRLNENVAQRALGTTVIASPDPRVRWRIAGATVERTTDSGSNWLATPTGLDVQLTAGAATSSSVCWLVGRGGAVLITTDGRTWRRVAFPETTDLSAVQATDAQSAVVTTADGRVFSTSDAGATWIRRSLQEIRTAPF
ncbi:MAG TPA: hypothetical protein VLT86_13250 [Vicinamibacterales bacterium]|nr:hypothetical protein [Vicinamibacterales bacterium]